MAFYGKIVLDGQPFKLLNCSFDFHQEIDSFHSKPTHKPVGGLLHITVEGQLGDETILAWMLSNTMLKSGSTIFFRDDSTTPLRNIVFDKAYCISYEEEFDHADQENLKISFTISAKTVAIEGQPHKNTW